MVSSLHVSSWALDIFSRYLGDIVRNKVRPRDTVPNKDKRMVDWALIKLYAKLFNSLKHGAAPTNALSVALRYKRKLWGKLCIYRTVSRHWCLISVRFSFRGAMQIQKYCASNSESNVIESLFSRRSSNQDYERIPRDQRYLVQDKIPIPIHWSGLLRFFMKWDSTVSLETKYIYCSHCRTGTTFAHLMVLRNDKPDCDKIQSKSMIYKRDVGLLFVANERRYVWLLTFIKILEQFKGKGCLVRPNGLPLVEKIQQI